MLKIVLVLKNRIEKDIYLFFFFSLMLYKAK